VDPTGGKVGLGDGSVGDSVGKPRGDLSVERQKVPSVEKPGADPGDRRAKIRERWMQRMQGKQREGLSVGKEKFKAGSRERFKVEGFKVQPKARDASLGRKDRLGAQSFSRPADQSSLGAGLRKSKLQPRRTKEKTSAGFAIGEIPPGSKFRERQMTNSRQKRSVGRNMHLQDRGNAKARAAAMQWFKVGPKDQYFGFPAGSSGLLQRVRY